MAWLIDLKGLIPGKVRNISDLFVATVRSRDKERFANKQKLFPSME